MKRMFAAALAAVCAAVSAQAATKTWSPSNGGDMAAGANWSGSTKPTSSDSITINKAQSAPVTLSEDLTAEGGNSLFTANMELALTNATGEAKTLTLSKFYLGGGSRNIRLTAGTIAFSNLYLGDYGTAYVNDVFSVEGAGTALQGGAVYVGTKAPNDTLVVSGGASLTGPTLNIGRNESTSGSSPSTNNCFRATGSGTTVAFSTSVNFGSSGLCRLEVLDGATFATTNLYVRHNTSYKDIPWYGGNSVRVSGTGSKIVVNGASNGGIMLGDTPAPDCTIVVENGALWESRGEFKLGWNNYVTNAMVRVASGATLKHDNTYLQIGALATGTNLVLEVDGGTVSVGENSSSPRGVYVKGFDCAARISNGGLLKTTGDIGIGSGVGTNAMLSVSGAASKVQAGATLRIYPGSSLNVEIPSGGFANGAAPVTCKTLTLNAAGSLAVSLGDGWGKEAAGTYRIVIAEAENDISVPAGFTISVPADSEHVKVERDTTNAKQLAFNVRVTKSGLAIIVR